MDDLWLILASLVRPNRLTLEPTRRSIPLAIDLLCPQIQVFSDHPGVVIACYLKCNPKSLQMSRQRSCSTFSGNVARIAEGSHTKMAKPVCCELEKEFANPLKHKVMFIEIVS